MSPARLLVLVAALAATALVALPSCRPAQGQGMEVGISLDSGVFGKIGSLKLVASTPKGFVQKSRETVQSGVTAQTEGPDFVVTFDAAGGYAFTSTVSFVLDTQVASPVDVTFYAEAYNQDGKLIGVSEAKTETAQPGERVPVTLSVACAMDACGEIPDGGVPLDAGADAAVAPTFTLTGSKDETQAISQAAVCRFRKGEPASLVVGMPKSNPNNHASGRVLVFHGKDRSWVGALDLTKPDFDIIVDYPGMSANEQIGEALSCADLTGAGHDDLIIGAPKFNDGQGRVYVVWGDDIMAAKTLNLCSYFGDAGVGGPRTVVGNALVVDGPAPRSSAGAAAIGARLHSAAQASLVIGAPGADAGAVYVLSPDDLKPLPRQVALADGVGIPLAGPGSGAQFGAALAAGSLTSDQAGALDDLAIGSPRAQRAADASVTGAVYVLSAAAITGGPDGGVVDPAGGVTIWGTKTSDFGRSLSIGAFDDNTVKELAIGAPKADGTFGAVYVMEGKANFFATKTLDVSVAQTARLKIRGPGESAFLGESLAIVVPGRELWTGASGVGGFLGAAYLFRGSNSLPYEAEATSAALVVYGEAASGHFGKVVAAGQLGPAAAPYYLVVAPAVKDEAQIEVGKVYGYLAP